MPTKLNVLRVQKKISNKCVLKGLTILRILHLRRSKKESCRRDKKQSHLTFDNKTHQRFGITR